MHLIFNLMQEWAKMVTNDSAFLKETLVEICSRLKFSWVGIRKLVYSVDSFLKETLVEDLEQFLLT